MQWRGWSRFIEVCEGALGGGLHAATLQDLAVPIEGVGAKVCA